MDSVRDVERVKLGEGNELDDARDKCDAQVESLAVIPLVRTPFPEGLQRAIPENNPGYAEH